MKNGKQVIVVILIVFTLALTACDGSPNTGGEDTDWNPVGLSTLSGTITISPDESAELGAVLTANYTGTETVSFQWKRGTVDIGEDSDKYITDKTGSYTVTVSADGFVSKTSGAVIVMSHPVTVEEGSTLSEKLSWIYQNVESYSTYIIEVSADESIGGRQLIFPSMSNITIVINGDEEERILSSSGTSIIGMFEIRLGVTIVLGSNITLKGNTSIGSVINILADGTFEMKEGAKIIGNNSSEGGGVYVNGGTFTMDGGEISGNLVNQGGGVYMNGGTFTMNGGEISGNKCNSGGGVYVNSGTFTMNGGKISGNTDGASSATNINTFGGGVYAGSNGTFIMNDGEISNNKVSSGGGGVYGSLTMNGGTICDNTVTSSSGDSRGGGVFVDSYRGTFTITGGTICGNMASSSSNEGKGGGVYLPQNAAFTMTGGEISGDNKAWYGGGVYVEMGTFFTMNGGEISGNRGFADGGGVYMTSGTNTMTGGEISGNEAGNYGGGVYVGASARFTMTGGEISGNKTVSSDQQSGGGGVYVVNDSLRRNFFRIVTGTVYGEGEGDLSNTVRYSGFDRGAAVKGSAAERGTFSGETWNKTGSIGGNSTVRVVNGELVE